MMALLAALAMAGSPEGTLNTDATVAFGFRPGLALQLDHGVWKGFWLGGRWASQQEAYWVAGNLGDFTQTGTWHHGLYIGGGLRAVIGKHDRWDIGIGVYVGQEVSFVRETIVYDNAGQPPPYEVTDRRIYQSWQAGFSAIPLPTLRFRFAKNHGLVLQPWYSLSHPLMIERAYLGIGWTARWGGDKVGSGG